MRRELRAGPSTYERQRVIRLVRKLHARERRAPTFVELWQFRCGLDTMPEIDLETFAEEVADCIRVGLLRATTEAELSLTDAGQAAVRGRIVEDGDGW